MAKKKTISPAAALPFPMLKTVEQMSKISGIGENKSGHRSTISAAISKNGHHKKAKFNPHKPLIYAGLLLAETVGFEPTSPCGLLDFELFEGKFR